MRIQLLPRIKPGSRSSTVLHGLFNTAVVLVIFALTVPPINLPAVAVTVFLISKWRMFAVKPRHWLANLRANFVDISVGLSYIIFINGTDSAFSRLLLTLSYIFWVLIIKPGSTSIMVGVQAMLAQFVAMVALFSKFSGASITILVIATWLVCYSVARHFFSSFEEPNGRVMAHVWGIFGGELAWVLSHWTLAYGPLPQIAILLTVIGYSFAVSYYMRSASGLKNSQKNQFIIITAIVVLIIALLSQWQYNG